jgi:hypothetical protein
MRKHLLLLLLLPLGWLTSCSDDEDELRTATVQVTVRNPENYRESLAKETRVTLTNTDNGQSQTVNTDDAAGLGRATFTDVLPGTYTVAATRSLTEQQAQQLTGITRAVVLNASRSGVSVSTGTSPAPVELQLVGSPMGGLVIKEAYYTGSRTPTGGSYFSDQFFEIYNNSTSVIYLDSLCIADVYGPSGQINPATRTTEFQNDVNHTYVSSVWQIPGTGRQHPLQPGQSILIAQDGIDHRAVNSMSTVDLSRADWETYNERPDGADVDAPGVPNLTRLYFTGGFDWLTTVFGPGIIIFKTTNFSQLQQVAIPNSTQPARIKVPNSLILDGFEALRDGNSTAFKRLAPSLDAGFVFATDTYAGESFRRRVETTVGNRRVLKDTNNSGQDFEKLSRPTPKGF